MATTLCEARITLSYYEVAKLRVHAKEFRESGKRSRTALKIKMSKEAGLDRGWIPSNIVTQHTGHGKLRLPQLDVRRSGVDLSELRNDAVTHSVPILSIQSQLKSMEMDVPAQMLRNLLKERASEGQTSIFTDFYLYPTLQIHQFLFCVMTCLSRWGCCRPCERIGTQEGLCFYRNFVYN